MNRSDRARMASLDSALRRLDEAQRTALREIREAGFRVHSVAEARKVQAEYREAARLNASAVERMSAIASGRKAS